MRLSHWLVAGLIAVEWVNETGYWHRVLGYTAVSVIVLRVAYGMASQHASSRFYWPTKTQIQAHWVELRHGAVAPHIGHNPVGQIAVYAMWTLMLLLVLTGWLSQTDAYWGEDWPVDAHEIAANALMGLVVLHVLAVIVVGRLSRRNLVKQMLIGK